MSGNVWKCLGKLTFSAEHCSLGVVTEDEFLSLEFAPFYHKGDKIAATNNQDDIFDIDDEDAGIVTIGCWTGSENESITTNINLAKQS